MGYVVLLPEDQVFDRPRRSPDEPARTMVELGRHATLTSSRANLWRYPPQAENLRHFETVQEEVFVVLEGTFTFFLGDPPERFEVPPQSVVVVEPGTPSKLKNERDDDGLLFAYGAPADLGAEGAELMPEL